MLKVDRHVDSTPSIAPPFIPSKDGKVAMVMIPITTQASGTQLGDIVTNVRNAGKDALPAELQLHTTVGPAFGADAGNAFQGADFRLLAITAAVVAVLLLLTYRSPILWLFPLIVVGIADRVAALIAETILLATGFSYDGSTGGIISVLVFGAGANYALLFTSRYRDELQQRENKLDALTAAWKGSFPAILASNLTVVGALLMLLFVDSPAIRNLGASGPIGLLVALPAVNAIVPRWIFWPSIPKPTDADNTPTQQGADDVTPDNRWYHIAQKVQKRPVTTLLAGGVILIVLACGMIGTTFGLSQTEQFTTQTESVDGLHVLEKHYSAGMASPITIVAEKQNAPEVHRILDASNDVASVRPDPLDIGNWMRWTVIGKNEPSTPGALDTITNLRTQLGNKALVGGADAESYDQANTTRHDLKVAIPLIPLILLIVFLMLVIVLRALVAPILMILATTISAVAVFGLGAFVSQHIFNFPALDYTPPSTASSSSSPSASTTPSSSSSAPNNSPPPTAPKKPWPAPSPTPAASSPPPASYSPQCSSSSASSRSSPWHNAASSSPSASSSAPSSSPPSSPLSATPFGGPTNSPVAVYAPQNPPSSKASQPTQPSPHITPTGKARSRPHKGRAAGLPRTVPIGF